MIETFYKLNGKDAYLWTKSWSSIGIFVLDSLCFLEYKNIASDLQKPGLKPQPYHFWLAGFDKMAVWTYLSLSVNETVIIIMSQRYESIIPFSPPHMLKVGILLTVCLLLLFLLLSHSIDKEMPKQEDEPQYTYSLTHVPASIYRTWDPRETHPSRVHVKVR